jgi:type IV fimbrial biogenesis protein FimT
MTKQKAITGFTIIELVVTMAIFAILVALAAPSFTSVINNNRLTGNANELLSTLQSARMEAVRRNSRVVFCRNDDPDLGNVCNTGAGAWLGWMTFVDVNRNGDFDAGEVLLYSGTFTAPAQLQASPAISGGNQRLRFSPDGLAYSDAGVLLNAQFAFCIPTALPPENTRFISIGSGSRFNIARFDGGGLCAAPANT